MYSGSDSTESQNFAQWALNPSTYQNMSNDQVDWAALAQQWIIMKEAGPPPLPTQESQKGRPKPQAEGGEAPMDVENDRDEPPWNQQPQPPGNESWTWNSQNQSWGWNNAWTPPTGVPPPIPITKPPLLPTPGNFNQFNAPPDSTNDNATSFAGYNTTPNNDYTTGYWTSAGSSKQIKPHNRRFSKVNVPRPVQTVVAETTTSQPTLDAAKRKQLPAWIREGLEKMERDKLKQIEKEKEKQERDEYKERLKQNEKETMEILKTTIKEQQKSKFESDGEYSEEEVQEKKRPDREEPVTLTPEEQILNVRRTMTEILLKVTGREIEQICREELQRHQKKHKASEHRASAPSGANITARLGLGMYGGDSGSSEEDSDDEGYQKDRRDSDSELRDSIKRKKAEFSKTEREIEDKLAEAENRKHELANSRSPTPDTIDLDSQVDAKAQGRKSRQSPRPPLSTNSKNSDRKRRSHSSSQNSSGEEESYLDSSSKRRTSSRRSSSNSSISNVGKKSSSRRNRSLSRSRSKTPSKRRNSSSNNGKSSTKKSRRSRSRSERRDRSSSGKKSKRSRSRSRRRSRSSSYVTRRKRGRSRSRGRRSRSRSKRSRSRSYSRNRRSRSRSSRRRRSRSSSSGRGKRSRRR